MYLGMIMIHIVDLTLVKHMRYYVNCWLFVKVEVDHEYFIWEQSNEARVLKVKRVFKLLV